MIGQRIGSYTIVEKLGEGGMGVVYRATDSRLHRDVALKFIPESLASDAQTMGRFEREAQVLASINHPNIAAIYGLEESEGRRALVMELAPGEELATRIARAKIPLDEALRIALAIAEALEAAHDRGIIHRDLKPANIKLGDPGESGGGRIKILDFGLAKALQSDGGASSASIDLTHAPTIAAATTHAGMILGTASYMSPEQARGVPADRRADIWSFGAILFEMLAGKRAFLGETVAETLAKLLEREPDWSLLPATTPPAIKTLLERCLVKSPRQRLQAIGDARLVLEETLQSLAQRPSRAVEPAAEPIVTPRARGSARRRLGLTLWALLTAGALVWAVLATLRGGPRQAGAWTPLMRFKVALGDEEFDIARGSVVAFSPDGRRIAYVSGEGTRSTLYTRGLDQLTPVRLDSGETTGAGPYHPFFSPDGSWVGFVTPSELRKVKVGGGTPVKICDVSRSRGVAWLPDDTIVIAPTYAGGLARVSAAGGELTPVTEVDATCRECSHRWPQALPGGKQVLFTNGLGENYDQASLEVVALETGERKVVYQGGSYGRYLPSGHLVFENSGTLFAVRFDIDRLEVEGVPAPVLENLAISPPEGGAQFDVSADGTLVYLDAEGRLDSFPIVWVERDGTSQTLWADQGAYVNPRLSPDGNKLALTVLRDDNWDLWVLDLERGVPIRLTFDDSVESEQIWSPDGEYLIFSSNRDAGLDSLYRKRADGSGEIERLTVAEKDHWANSLSRDGRYVAFVEGDTQYDIWILDLETRETIELLGTPATDGSPDFSPDGRWLVYSSDSSGRSEIYVRPFPEGEGKWQISEGGGGTPRWSRNGDEIFWRTESGIAGVEVDVSTGSFRAGKPREIFAGAFQGGVTGMAVGGLVFADYDVAPDGRFVMFPDPRKSGGGYHPHLTLVTRWFDELERLSSAGKP